MAFQSRRKFCFFKENSITEVDYKDVKLLRRFVTDQGKIMPRRITGTSAKMHRKLVRAIKYYKIKSFTSFKNGESYIDTRLFDKRL